MPLLRWIFFILSIAAGLGLGLYYGWVVNPVQFVDTVPNTMRADFSSDYTLMVAEIYQKDQDIENAANRLAFLNSGTPAEIASAALSFAQQNNFHPEDMLLLKNLSIALQVWEPDEVNPEIAPSESQP